MSTYITFNMPSKYVVMKAVLSEVYIKLKLMFFSQLLSKHLCQQLFFPKDSVSLWFA